MCRRVLVRIAVFLGLPLLVAGAEPHPNLPLGLPSDQNVPTKLDGYKLVALDRTKEAVFLFDEHNIRLKVDLPIFIYIPERDRATEMRRGLSAIHSQLAQLSSQSMPVEAAQLMTLFLALDRVISSAELPVAHPDAKEPSPGQPEESEPAESRLEQAIRKNG